MQGYLLELLQPRRFSNRGCRQGRNRDKRECDTGVGRVERGTRDSKKTAMAVYHYTSWYG